MIYAILSSIAMRFKGGMRYGGKELNIPFISSRLLSSLLILASTFLVLGLSSTHSLIIATTWFVTNIPGLGEYLGNLMNKEPMTSKGDSPLIVKATEYIIENLVLEPSQLTYGIVGTALRGSINGIGLSLVCLSPLPAISGLTMPICYKLGFALEEKFPNIFLKESNFSGWAVGEWLFGFMLGCGVSYAF